MVYPDYRAARPPDIRRYVLTDEDAQVVSGLFQSTEEEIMRIYIGAGEDAR